MKAWIDNQKGIGYVVCWQDDHVNTLLRNFGQMYSAAYEFRDWLNRCTDSRLQSWVKMYAKSYNPNIKFTYPEIKENERPTLRKQKYEF